MLPSGLDKNGMNGNSVSRSPPCPPAVACVGGSSVREKPRAARFMAATVYFRRANMLLEAQCYPVNGSQHCRVWVGPLLNGITCNISKRIEALVITMCFFARLLLSKACHHNMNRTIEITAKATPTPSRTLPVETFRVFQIPVCGAAIPLHFSAQALLEACRVY